jgi:two-component system response regulator AtoC
LIDHFLTTRGPARPPFRVDSSARVALGRYDWPGNVRELANVLERAQVLADGDTITLDDLPDAVAAAAAAAPPADDDDRYSLAATKRRLLHEVLLQVLGNRMAAARLMGVSPRTLYRMIERGDRPAAVSAYRETVDGLGVALIAPH